MRCTLSESVLINPDSYPLAEVEAYLIAAGGPWALIPSGLSTSIKVSQPEDHQQSEEMRRVLRRERERAYSRAVRAFAKQYQALATRKDNLNGTSLVA